MTVYVRIQQTQRYLLPYAFAVLITLCCRTQSVLTASRTRDGSTTTTLTKSSTPLKRLTEASMSQSLKKMEYAVRGKVVIAADKLHQELQSSTASSTPFSRIIYTNIGNPQSVGQLPLTWPRQVLALAELPEDMGIHHPNVEKMFPTDAIARATHIQRALGGHGTGAYTHSQGPYMFREEIARFIERRDELSNQSVRPETIFMTDGASTGIRMILTALIQDSSCGVMIPIPQYPIYSATIDLLGGTQVGYYLNESHGWDFQLEELERSLRQAKERNINVTSFVLINPNNPTGHVYSRQTVQEIVQFCAKHRLVLLADEVYQENVYDHTAEFYSCKRAAHDTNLLTTNTLELASFHSTSKGLFGECGHRGGYMELTGFDHAVTQHIYKLASSGLCSNVPGQIMMSLMVQGPNVNDVSYDSFENEKKCIWESLKRRAKIAVDGFNAIDGFECHPAQGAMYCFPKVELPKAAIEAAVVQDMTPDTLYALSLLEHTGICVVPASGFGQEVGRVGFRTTFLPLEDDMKLVVQAVKDHHSLFCRKYSDNLWQVK